MACCWSPLPKVFSSSNEPAIADPSSRELEQRQVVDCPDDQRRQGCATQRDQPHDTGQHKNVMDTLFDQTQRAADHYEAAPPRLNNHRTTDTRRWLPGDAILAAVVYLVEHAPRERWRLPVELRRRRQ